MFARGMSDVGLLACGTWKPQLAALHNADLRISMCNVCSCMMHSTNKLDIQTVRSPTYTPLDALRFRSGFRCLTFGC